MPTFQPGDRVRRKKNIEGKKCRKKYDETTIHTIHFVKTNQQGNELLVFANNVRGRADHYEIVPSSGTKEGTDAHGG